LGATWAVDTEGVRYRQKCKHKNAAKRDILYLKFILYVI
jgi:hypothetical protein